MTLEDFGVETTDPLFSALDELVEHVDDVDTTYADDRDEEIALELARCKQSLTRAKRIRGENLGLRT